MRELLSKEPSAPIDVFLKLLKGEAQADDATLNGFLDQHKALRIMFVKIGDDKYLPFEIPLSVQMQIRTLLIENELLVPMLLDSANFKIVCNPTSTLLGNEISFSVKLKGSHNISESFGNFKCSYPNYRKSLSWKKIMSDLKPDSNPDVYKFALLLLLTKTDNDVLEPSWGDNFVLTQNNTLKDELVSVKQARQDLSQMQKMLMHYFNQATSGFIHLNIENAVSYAKVGEQLQALAAEFIALKTQISDDTLFLRGLNKALGLKTEAPLPDEKALEKDFGSIAHRQKEEIQTAQAQENLSMDTPGRVLAKLGGVFNQWVLAGQSVPEVSQTLNY